MKKLQDSGVAHVAAIMLSVVLVIIGAVGYRVYKNSEQKTGSSKPTESQNIQEAEKTGMLTYVDDNPGFSIDYPDDWKITDKQEEIVGESETYLSGEVSFVSPTGTKLTISYEQGGRGGWCEPQPQDIPHKITNECATWELLSRGEVVDIDPQNTGYLDGRAPVTLITTKYTPSKHSVLSEPKTLYSLCLTNEEFWIEQVVNKPEMGAVIFPCGSVVTPRFDFRMIASSENAEFLTSDDAQTVIRMFESITLKKHP